MTETSASVAPSVVPPARPPERLLLGPGPSPVSRAILEALARPTIGHLDPAFLAIMDEIRAMLRTLFATTNRLTLPLSSTGSSGMEACLVNLLEPGDRALIGVCGVFGRRMVEVARRAGAEVTEVSAPWGRPVPVAELAKAAAGGPYKLLAIVHGETSTGVRQDIAPLRDVADRCGALLVIDAVTTLGGIPVTLDGWGVDAAYSGTQKCLGCPPGLSPVSLSDRALAAIRSRRSPVQSWCLDLGLIASYWGEERAYHHTAPINMLYGLHEALRQALEEGLERRFARHRAASEALWSGLEAMGLDLLVAEEDRLLPLTSVRVPQAVDETAVRRLLLDRSAIEIGGGLGELKGKVWRIGLMGSGATRENVDRCLEALADALRQQGWVARG